MIYAGLDGIKRGLRLTGPVNTNLLFADKSITEQLKTLPSSLSEAIKEAESSAFVRSVLPDMYIGLYK